MKINISASEMLNAKIFAQNEAGKTGIMERLSSGLKINRAADAPAELGIKNRIDAQMGGLLTSIQNLEDMLVYCQSREASMRDQLNAAQAIRDLALQASQEATLSDAQRSILNDEAKALVSLVDDIGNLSSIRPTTSGVENAAKTLVSVGGELDVLWVMDQTGSMGTHLTALANEAATKMFGALTAKGFDLRMAAVGFGTAVNNFSVEPDPMDQPRGYLGHTDLQFPWASAASLSDPGVGRVFRDTGAAFKSDVQLISAVSSGSHEPGIDAVYDAAMLFNVAPSASAGLTDFRQDAKKVIMMITDEASSDSQFGKNTTRDVPNYFMDEVVDALNNRFGDIQVWSIANMVGDPGNVAIDEDYIEFSARASGLTIPLDVVYGGTDWVNEAARNLQGIVGDYSRDIQVGANASDRMTLDFRSVNAKTSGIESIDISTASLARTSIETADSAIEYISEELAATGAYINILSSIVDSNNAAVMSAKETLSRIADADFAEEATALAKTDILIRGSVMAAKQIETNKRTVVDIVYQHGVGEQGGFLGDFESS